MRDRHRITIEASRFRDKRPVNKLQLPFTPDKGEIRAEILARFLQTDGKKKKKKNGARLDTKERCVPAQFIDTPFISPIAETFFRSKKKKRKKKRERAACRRRIKAPYPRLVSRATVASLLTTNNDRFREILLDFLPETPRDPRS